MKEWPPVEELFAGRHFDAEIVVLCVRWYLSFKLSYRDLVRMMSERGIAMAHTTILRWVHPLLASANTFQTPLRDPRPVIEVRKDEFSGALGVRKSRHFSAAKTTFAMSELSDALGVGIVLSVVIFSRVRVPS